MPKANTNACTHSPQGTRQEVCQNILDVHMPNKNIRTLEKHAHTKLMYVTKWKLNLRGEEILFCLCVKYHHVLFLKKYQQTALFFHLLIFLLNGFKRDEANEMNCRDTLHGKINHS